MSISQGRKTDAEMSQMTTFSLLAAANSRHGSAAEVLKKVASSGKSSAYVEGRSNQPAAHDGTVPAPGLRAFLTAEQAAIAAAKRSFHKRFDSSGKSVAYSHRHNHRARAGETAAGFLIPEFQHPIFEFPIGRRRAFTAPV
jgi:hypothetical protein